MAVGIHVASMTAGSGPRGKEATFDGRGSFDADGSIVSYAWDFGDGHAASGSLVGHAFLMPGAYAVRLTVTDDDGPTGDDGAEVIVLTPGQGIEKLIETIDGFVGNGDLTAPSAGSLIRTLDQASDLLTKGSAGAARNKLGDFIDQVDALVRSGRLAPSDDQVLKETADDLIAAIDATTP